jgi:DNA-binding winged helix-turn-helix (wHTH) protein
VSPIGSEEITFGRFRLHPGRRELLRDEVPVRLHRRALDILCALAAAKGAIVGKDELLALLWPGRIVEEGNLHVHVSGLRRALDRHGEGYSYIVTVPGRGYRLAGFTIAVLADSAAAPLPTTAATARKVVDRGFAVRQFARGVRSGDCRS